MRRVLARALCALFSLTVAFPATNLLDSLTLRVESQADVWNLNLAGALPTDVIESVGSTDIRQLLQYDAPAHQLVVRTFLAPQGAAAPTSLLVVENNQVEAFRVDVASINLDEARRTVTIFGVVAEGFSSPVHGAYAGDAIQVVVQYSGPPAIFFDRVGIYLRSGQQISTYAGSGQFLVEHTPNRPPVPDVGPDVIESYLTEIFIDSTKSSDPDGDELDFKWHVMSGAATLRGCETATPILQLVQGRGAYDLRLTLTDSRGATAYRWVRINYVGR